MYSESGWGTWDPSLWAPEPNISDEITNAPQNQQQASPACAAVFSTYELVENILLQLHPGDIWNCIQVNNYVRKTTERSKNIFRHVGGPLPPGHDEIWEVKEDGTIIHKARPMNIHEAFNVRPMRRTCFRIVPVTWNKAVLRGTPWMIFWIPDYAPRECEEKNMTRGEACAWIAHTSRMWSDHGCFRFVLDFETLTTTAPELDFFLTKPPVTRVVIVVQKPGARRRNSNCYLRYDARGECRQFVVKRDKGVRVRDVAETVSKAGHKWVRRLNPMTSEVIIEQHAAALYDEEVLACIRRLGTVAYRW